MLENHHRNVLVRILRKKRVKRRAQPAIAKQISAMAGKLESTPVFQRPRGDIGRGKSPWKPSLERQALR